MCGIFGLTGFKLNAATLALLARSLRHRGPDSEGRVLIEDATVLGHNRLSIIDLSDAGRQPMSSDDKTVWITYNGEIYNYRELRNELIVKGYHFKSQTDTEVILRGYEEWGIEELLARLNGMFAFAICDSRTRSQTSRLILARDRLGIKPLYYALYNGIFGFASEIKALLALDMLPREINWQAIFDYFSFLYIPYPQTAFRNIYQLPPAHYLIYNLSSEKVTVKDYWNPLGQEKGDRNGGAERSFGDLRDELRGLLEDSVRRQLISDVPLGVFLSGGIDSSILAALASRASSDRLKTFTVLFEGPGITPYDETEYARKVSRKYNTDHHEIMVNLSQPEDLLDLVSCFDQPFANPTFYLSYLISKKTKEHVTVALSGAGGDELFGGYPRYRVLPYSRLLGALPQTLHFGTAAFLRLFRETYDGQSLRRLKLLSRGIGQDFSEQYLRWTYYFSDEEKRDLLSPLLAQNGHFEPSVRIVQRYLDEAQNIPDLPTRVQYLDLKTFLADNILEYTDRTSMAASLEVRVPFLDHRVVELSFCIPWSYKIKNGISKYILKETFRNLIPKENLEAPKRGFCPPLPVWMERFLDRYFDERMGTEYVKYQGIFNWEVIQQLRRMHKQHRRDNSMELLGIIMFDMWWRKYIIGETW